MGDAIDLDKLSKDVPPGRFIVAANGFGKGNMYTKFSYTNTLNEVEKWWTGALFGLAGDGLNIMNVSRATDVAPSPENPLYQQTVAQKAQIEVISGILRPETTWPSRTCLLRR